MVSRPRFVASMRKSQCHKVAFGLHDEYFLIPVRGRGVWAGGRHTLSESVGEVTLNIGSSGGTRLRYNKRDVK